MNIQSLQNRIAGAYPARPGGRLDVRSDAPAPAEASASSVAPADRPPQTVSTPGLEGANLLGVLNPHERTALEAAFAPESAAYSLRGTTVDAPPVTGSQLDLTA